MGKYNNPLLRTFSSENSPRKCCRKEEMRHEARIQKPTSWVSKTSSNTIYITMSSIVYIGPESEKASSLQGILLACGLKPCLAGQTIGPEDGNHERVESFWWSCVSIAVIKWRKASRRSNGTLYQIGRHLTIWRYLFMYPRVLSSRRACELEKLDDAHNEDLVHLRWAGSIAENHVKYREPHSHKMTLEKRITLGVQQFRPKSPT